MGGSSSEIIEKDTVKQQVLLSLRSRTDGVLEEPQIRTTNIRVNAQRNRQSLTVGTANNCINKA